MSALLQHLRLSSRPMDYLVPRRCRAWGSRLLQLPRISLPATFARLGDDIAFGARSAANNFGLLFLCVNVDVTPAGMNCHFAVTVDYFIQSLAGRIHGSDSDAANSHAQSNTRVHRQAAMVQRPIPPFETAARSQDRRSQRSPSFGSEPESLFGFG